MNAKPLLAMSLAVLMVIGLMTSGWAGSLESVNIFKNPDKGFFLVFRFYGPLEGYLEKTWKLGDLEMVE
jgi:hypothetical protein